ncbi:hypothetical protein [Streptomyces albipurpureus]|uniref:Uncharacterized protein n=1 Tax=Streptomyces albipurpureus TaxID=2897419 RepID=A0ABT0UEF5_9ACTN|nr:hypothetical protein [Streptomyces sp. CWNU-1]MCM2386892.1 hypothetical protein [Streptomyces sp. CWNU-1]
MNTYNIGSVSGGQNQFGDHGVNVSGGGRAQINHGASPAEAIRLAGELVRRLRQDQPALVGQAELLEGELVSAQREGREVDQGRVRRWLEAISAGAGAAGGALALAQALGGAIGL